MLATLWVTLGLKKEGFDRGAKESKDKIKEVGTEAEKTGTKVDDVGKKGKDAFGPAMILGAVTAAVVAVKKFGDAVIATYRAIGDKERAVSSLAKALENNGKDVDLTRNKYLAFADEMQKVTNVEDDLVVKLLTLAENMRAADPMEAVKGAIALSKAYGIELTQGVKMATLAQEGNFNMLSRTIPALKTATTASEQLAIYQQAVAGGFKIATSEAADSLGVMEKLKISWGDFSENLGKVTQTNVQGFFSGLVEWLDDVNYILSAKTVPEWKKWFAIITGINAATIRQQVDVEQAEKKRHDASVANIKAQLIVETDYTAIKEDELAKQMAVEKEAMDAAKARLIVDDQINTWNGKREKDYTRLKTEEEAARAEASYTLLSEETARRKMESNKQIEDAQRRAEKLEEIRNKEATGLQDLIDGLSAYTKGTENYYNQLIAINDKRIKNLTGGEIRDSLIAENQELKNQIYLLGVSAEKRAELASQSVAPERMTAIGTPSVTGGVTPRPLPMLQMSEALQSQQDGIKSQYEQMVADADAFGQALTNSLNNGAIAGLQALAQSIGETGNINMGAMVAAILNPLGDMAITTGILAIGIGNAIDAIKASLTTFFGGSAVLAGVALIALGVAAKAGAAAIAKGSGGGGGRSYSSGGNYGSNSYTTQRIEIYGVLSKGDIYLSNRAEAERRGR